MPPVIQDVRIDLVIGMDRAHARPIGYEVGMAAFITSLLCAMIVIRPREFVQALAWVPVLHVLCGVLLFCIVLDKGRMARIRMAMPPQIPLFFAFLTWALFVSLIKRPDTITTVLGSFAILSGIFLAVTIGFSTTKGILLFASVHLACALLLAGVAITQYVSPFECFRGEADDWAGTGDFSPDGRPCDSVRDCRIEDSNDTYRCERGGLFGTHTVGGRVRYRGALGDPNELSLMLSSALPFGLAFAEVRRTRRGSDGEARPSPEPFAPAPRTPAGKGAGIKPVRIRWMLAAMLIGLLGFIVAIAQSRMGLMTFLLIIGVYFIRRVGAWGILVACLVAPPMLLWGGRSGAEADASADERTELIFDAFEMIRKTKGIGVGAEQFADESSVSMTAHNTYLLAAAETGIVGLVLFGTFLYLCIKVPAVLWFGRYRISPTTAKMAPALAISLCGLAFGIAFLSWAYEHLLYVLAGASCALYAAAKAEDPRIDVRLSAKEMVLIPLGIMALLVVFHTGARLRM